MKVTQSEVGEAKGGGREHVLAVSCRRNNSALEKVSCDQLIRLSRSTASLQSAPRPCSSEHGVKVIREKLSCIFHSAVVRILHGGAFKDDWVSIIWQQQSSFVFMSRGWQRWLKFYLNLKNISMKNHPILKHMFEDEQLKRYENYSWGLSGKINGTISCLLKYYV